MTKAVNLAAVGSNANSGGTLITSGTAVASTSGTSIDFTGIPSWVKRVTVMFSGVSTNGTSTIQIQIGAGSVTTSGYVSTTGFITNGGAVGAATSTTGFVTVGASTNTDTVSGVFQVTNLAANTWCFAGSCYRSGGSAGTGVVSAVPLTLGGTLDRVRITTVNGTDTFDAGSINILYE